MNKPKTMSSFQVSVISITAGLVLVFILGIVGSGTNKPKEETSPTPATPAATVTATVTS